MNPSEKSAEWYPYVPAIVPPPGETVRETLEELEMSQSKLAARTGLTLKHVNQIVQGNASITPTTALALERATSVPASFWNALEADYQDHKVRAEEVESLAKQSDWLSRMPLADLRKRGFVTATRRDPGRQLQEVLAFFGVGSIAAWEVSWDQPAAAFLQSSAYEIDPGAVAAWLRLGELAAEEAGQTLEFGPFDRADLRARLPALRELTLQPPSDFFPKACSLLAEVGVCLVVVPDIGGTRASGASRFLSPARALVQLSNRGKRNDKFWFSLFHELAHLLLHGKKETFMQFEERSPSGSAYRIEEEANDFAGRLLIPREAEAELLAISTTAEALALAARLGVTPGIVAGRYQRETQKWSFGRSLFEFYEITED